MDNLKIKIKKKFFNIFIYGDSNTWGYVPTLTPYSGDDNKTDRYDRDDIWWNKLNDDYFLFVNGVNGRTISLDHPDLEGRNALKTIDADFTSAAINLSIIMLGTNDLKDCYKKAPSDLIDDMDRLVNKINDRYHSLVLLISPPLIMPSPITNAKYTNGVEKINEYDKLLKEYAHSKGYLFASAKGCEVGVDGEHLTKEGHKKLGKIVYEKVKEIKWN